MGHSSRVQDCLEALAKALEWEIGQTLARALDFERVYKDLLVDAVLLTRSRAARIMSMSTASLDRKVANKEIEVIYADGHPRFELTEIKRFIEARRGKMRRGKRGRE